MPMMRTARFQVKPESLANCQQAITEFVDYIKANEPGTLRYTSMQQEDDPTRFMHFMIFQDEAAQETHRSSPGVKRFTDVLYPETVAGVEFTSYQVIAST